MATVAPSASVDPRAIGIGRVGDPACLREPGCPRPGPCHRTGFAMSTATSQAAPLSAYAIQVDARDNVAVAKVPVPRGTLVQVGANTVEVIDDVSPGHRFALVAIPDGDFVRQYGQPIGTSKGVAAGALISRANMSNDVPVVRELDEDMHTAAPEYVPEAQRATFMGYRRPMAASASATGS